MLTIEFFSTLAELLEIGIQILTNKIKSNRERHYFLEENWPKEIRQFQEEIQSQ